MPIRTYGPADFVASASILEAAFDVAWTGDHLLWHYPVLDPIVTLTSVALLTRRIQLGTAILIAPIRPVLWTAKALASLDHISGGRVIAGFGVGGEMEHEFEVLGIPVAERGPRTDEAIAAMRVLWGADGGSFHGRFLAFDDVRLTPGPVRAGGPPIWIGGRTRRAVERAARLADGWLGLFLSPAQFAERREQLEAGIGDGRAVTMGLHLPTCIGGADAQERLRGFYGGYPTLSADRFAKFWATGSAEQIIDLIGAYAEAGVEHIVLAPPGPEFVPQLEALATEVVPVVRRDLIGTDGAPQ